MLQHKSDMEEGSLTDGWMRECAVCYRRGKEDEFFTCEGCQAMVYCSTTCQQTDWDGGETTASYSHKHWCARMKSYMDRGKELTNFPFTFAYETTDRLFHEQKLADFLIQHGVYGRGFWRRESPSLHKHGQCRKCGVYTQDDANTWVIPSVSAVLDLPPSVSPPQPACPLCSWTEYYSYRGLQLDCPAAAILTFPLTLYYILTTCLKSQVPEVFSQLLEREELVIHMLGVEREVEIIPAFLECARLLPYTKLHIRMYGKNLSKNVNHHSWQKENLQVTVQRCWYHDASDLAPHLAVGFNAGLPAYPTWPATLKKLMEQRTPAFFTDQSEYSVDSVSESISYLGLAGISPVIVNPFRSPLRIVMKEQNMPWFSNAFLFSLRYREST